MGKFDIHCENCNDWKLHKCDGVKEGETKICMIKKNNTSDRLDRMTSVEKGLVWAVCILATALIIHIIGG